MQLVDYHIHTELCRHATGSMREYVERALECELSEMGFSDHFPVYHLADDDHRRKEYGMDFETLPEYMWRVTELRLDYPEIPIRVGLEMDYIPGYEGQIADWLADYPFDYVIGSVHFIDDWSFDDPRYAHRYDEWELIELWNEYFNRVQQAARSGLFDIIGHLDVIKKFGRRPRVGLTEIYRETARALADGQVCIEINTSGLRTPARELYPSRKLLAVCKEFEVPITLGSDAHTPSDVGRNLVLAAKLAQSVGYDHVVTFEERERSLRFLGY